MLDYVEAIIINHNTSLFAEIALRSLHLAAERANADVRVTVVDNHSTDDTAALHSAIEECGASWELSRWPAGQQPLPTHGDVLHDFVLARPEAPAFLFADSDICFHEPDAIAVLLAEIDEMPDVWAVQARLLTNKQTRQNTYLEVGPASFLEMMQRKRRGITSVSKVSFDNDEGVTASYEMVHEGRRMPRCHPACALIRNSEPFQLAVRHLGLSACWTWANDVQLGGLSDTMSLVSRAMRTHNLWYRISQTAVIHFWHGANSSFTQDQELLLSQLRRRDVDQFVSTCRATLEEDELAAHVPGS